jgi:CHAT domain-containing protein
MQEFYRIREGSPGMTKLEALREAQLEPVARRSAQSSRCGSAIAESIRTEHVGSLASFPIDKNAPYAHPYYWAPFFLMGNWL